MTNLTIVKENYLANQKRLESIADNFYNFLDCILDETDFIIDQTENTKILLSIARMKTKIKFLKQQNTELDEIIFFQEVNI
jgi:hypothetical protein